MGSHFTGRMARLTYLKWVLICVSLGYVAIFGGSKSANQGIQVAFGHYQFGPSGIFSAQILAGIAIAVIALVSMLFLLASVTVRRLHDMNFTGHHYWWMVVLQNFPSLIGFSFIPEVASIFLGVFNYTTLVWLSITPGTNGDNRFGPQSSAFSSPQRSATYYVLIAIAIGASIEAVVVTTNFEDHLEAWLSDDTPIDQFDPKENINLELIISHLSGMQIASNAPEFDEIRYFNAVSAEIFEYLLLQPSSDINFPMNQFAASAQLFSSTVRQCAVRLKASRRLKYREEALLQRLIMVQKAIIQIYDLRYPRSNSVNLENTPIFVNRKVLVEDQNETEMLLNINK